MKTFYIIKTTSDMFRAKGGERYPWTRLESNAMRFPTARMAEKERRFYAGKGARPVSSYQVIEVIELPDGSHAFADVSEEG